MKGTIDINITRKDGTTEHRQEQNVVFDIPSFVLKKSLEYPEISRVLRGGALTLPSAYNPGSFFNYFGLSEDTMDLTAPAFRPIALRCVGGTASKWYDSAVTRTVEDKKITVQATWTTQNALTLKSIGFLGVGLDNTILYFATGSYSTSSNDNYRTTFHLLDGHLYRPSHKSNYYGATTVVDLKLSNFKFSNTLGGLISANDAPVPYVIPYALANSDERAAFTSAENVKSKEQVPSTTSNRLCIYNKNNVDAPLRYFDLSQFEGINTTGNTSLGNTFIINTGTKNYLIQIHYNSSTQSYSRNAWQIPDTAVDAGATIPLASSTFLDTAMAEITHTSLRLHIVGNYVIFANTSNSYSSYSCIKISDDLSVRTYNGSAAAMGYTNVSVPSFYRYVSANESGFDFCSYMNTYNSGDFSYLPSTPDITTSLYNGNSSVLIPNYTAANFSTPIELAEGDVLTVSYKIEVA